MNSVAFQARSVAETQIPDLGRHFLSRLGIRFYSLPQLRLSLGHRSRSQAGRFRLRSVLLYTGISGRGVDDRVARQVLPTARAH